MGDEIDGQNETVWTKRYQVIVDEYYDTAEEAQEMADRINERFDVATDFEEIETSF